MNQMIEQMLKHKSIRKFKDKVIDENDLEAIVRSAQSASTSSFLQAYSIIRIKDKMLREKIAVYSGDQDYVVTAAEFLVFIADTHRMDKACGLHGYKFEKGMTETFIVATVDAALAAQNAFIAAESLGLGGVYIGGIRNNISEISELLKLPDDTYPIFGLCLGYPDQDPAVKERLPIDCILKTDFYQEDDEKTIAEYDKRIEKYYINRTKGRINNSWTLAVAKKVSAEMRPHMRRFLESKGFKMK